MVVVPAGCDVEVVPGAWVAGGAVVVVWTTDIGLAERVGAIDALVGGAPVRLTRPLSVAPKPELDAAYGKNSSSRPMTVAGGGLVP
jgi:hypothetical protein